MLLESLYHTSPPLQIFHTTRIDLSPFCTEAHDLLDLISENDDNPIHVREYNVIWVDG
jgi:hypothetical protein